ncbi:MAG: hypothetical protein ABI824_15285 [Acidobacteriota bacterium]
MPALGTATTHDGSCPRSAWVGYHPDLENEILPQTDNVIAEAERLLKY